MQEDEASGIGSITSKFVSTMFSIQAVIQLRIALSQHASPELFRATLGFVIA